MNQPLDAAGLHWTLRRVLGWQGDSDYTLVLEAR
jgi:hypothetical protein